MTAHACRRCGQVLVPGDFAPWCLGGRYRCDVSTAVLLPGPAADRPGPAPTPTTDPAAMTDAEVLADLRRRREPAPSARALRNRYRMRHDRAVRLLAEHAARADRSAGTGVAR